MAEELLGVDEEELPNCRLKTTAELVGTAEEEGVAELDNSTGTGTPPKT